jgi:DNA (cytosine-5)-methyltransferase 1
MTESLRYAELFGGAAGLALGAIRAGLRPVFATDIDADSVATYSRNVGPHAVCADLRAYDLSQIPAHDVLGFGFPCNDFSNVGKQAGLDGKYGPLYRHGIEVLRSHQPQAFVAENVDGLTSADDREALRVILVEMSDAGYDVVAHRYHLEEYGVPQRRHRVMIVGIRRDLGLRFEVPSPTTPQPITAGQALANIPSWAANRKQVRQSSALTERLRLIPPGGNAWSVELPAHLRLNCKLRMGNLYARLHPERPSPTITAAGGGGTHGYHWSEPRALTNRERARLQTFPDNFVFCGGVGSVRKQIGMAVPPHGALVVFSAVLATLRGDATPASRRTSNCRGSCRSAERGNAVSVHAAQLGAN